MRPLRVHGHRWPSGSRSCGPRLYGSGPTSHASKRSTAKNSPNQPRSLLALTELLAGTNLAGAQLVSTRTTSNEVYDERNLVVATTFAVLNVEQLRNDLVDPLSYHRLTANPPDAAAVTISIERPILHIQLDLPDGSRLHVINVHLKSKIPTDIPGQKIDNYTWRS
jgi:endonuclease/exonuclease/phosphatase family metal-dependent hydrolase